MIIVAGPEDRGAVQALTQAYLVERALHGSVYLATDRNLEFYMNIFDLVVADKREGVCFFSLDDGYEAVSLWGPSLPLDCTLGRVCLGQGTYVRPDKRRSGIAKEMYAFGFEELRSRGFNHFTGAVDTGNDAGVAHAVFQHAVPIQTTYVVRL